MQEGTPEIRQVDIDRRRDHVPLTFGLDDVAQRCNAGCDIKRWLSYLPSTSVVHTTVECHLAIHRRRHAKNRIKIVMRLPQINLNALRMTASSLVDQCYHNGIRQGAPTSEWLILAALGAGTSPTKRTQEPWRPRISKLARMVSSTEKATAWDGFAPDEAVMLLAVAAMLTVEHGRVALQTQILSSMYTPISVLRKALDGVASD